MRNLSKFVALSLVLSVSILMSALPAKADVVDNELVPFSATVPIDCDQDGTPEDVVELSGQLHVLLIQNTNNKVTTTKAQFVPRNVTGTSLISAANYRGVGLTTQISTVVGGGPTVFTFVNNFYIIGQGDAFKYLAHDAFHATVDADGNVVVAHDNSFVSCPGS